jgi:hypothetical protein
MKRKYTKKLLLTAAFVLVATLIFCGAADRYLIDHVEIDLSKQAGMTGESGSANGNLAGSAEEEYTADDMSYTSDSKAITITKVVAVPVRTRWFILWPLSS